MRYNEIIQEDPVDKNAIVEKFYDCFHFMDDENNDKNYDKKALSSKIRVNSNGVIDVQGNIYCGSECKDIPLRFGIVDGTFIVSQIGLTNLKNSPRVVNNFDCSANKLTSLAGGPDSVIYEYECNHNKLTTLEGLNLESCEGFYCNNNLLTNLIGSPKLIHGDFVITNNPLTSLEGLPDKIGGSFVMDYDPKLPLLRLVTADIQDIKFNLKHRSIFAIIEKYRSPNAKRSAVLACQKELIDTGFEGNAHW